MSVQALAREISRQAAEHGKEPIEISRDFFLTHCHDPKMRTLACRGSNWGDAKALSRRAEAVPERHVLGKITSQINAQTGEIERQWIRAAPNGGPSLEEITAALKKVKIRPIKKSKKPKNPTVQGLLNFFAIGDMHFGLRTDPKVTRKEHWNLQKNVDIHRAAFLDLIERSPKAETAVLANLGDASHIDNRANATTKGTGQDVGASLEEILRELCNFYVYAVNLALSSHDRVIVHTRGGNHDHIVALALAYFLQGRYAHEPRVTFGQPEAAIDYCVHGHTLICTTHGDELSPNKPKDLALKIAAEAPDKWGSTSYRVVHTGHVHHQSVKEVPGLIVQTHGILSPQDGWHARSTYDSMRAMSCITYTHLGGKVSEIQTSPALLRG